MAVRERGQLDLLLLGVLARGPANGYEVCATLRSQTRGRVAVSEQTTFRALHRLARNRLLERLPDHRFRLTAVGERALATRRRRWDETGTAVRSVLDGTG